MFTIGWLVNWLIWDTPEVWTGESVTTWGIALIVCVVIDVLVLPRN